MFLDLLVDLLVIAIIVLSASGEHSSVYLFFIAVLASWSLSQLFLPEFRKHFLLAGYTITINDLVLIDLCGVIAGLLYLVYFSVDVTVALFILGILANMSPMVFNRGFFPIPPSAFLKLHGELAPTNSEGGIKFGWMLPIYCYTGPATKLSFLGDIFYIKSMKGIFSVGDFLIFGSLFYGLISQTVNILKTG